MDIVGNVLQALKLQSTVFCSLDLYGAWGFAKRALEGAPFHVIIEGEAWLRVPGMPEVRRLAAGDVVILPRRERHDLIGRPDAPLIPFDQVLEELGWEDRNPGVQVRPAVYRYGSGDERTCRLVSGVFDFGDRRKNPLLEALPRVLHLKSEDIAQSGEVWLASTVAFLAAEVVGREEGSSVVAARLADILLIQAVRRYIGSGEPLGDGWLRGLTDPQIGRVLSLMHAQPDRRWSVASLAEAAGMSRSRFAARFQELVGRAPLQYLTQVRMHEAAGRLAEAKVCLATLAEQAGYSSEPAFSKAFKRWSGQSPAEYKRRGRERAPAGSGLLPSVAAVPR